MSLQLSLRSLAWRNGGPGPSVTVSETCCFEPLIAASSTELQTV